MPQLQTKECAENQLYNSGMCRTERISFVRDGDFLESIPEVLKVREGDILAFTRLSKALEKLKVPTKVPYEFVKSSPYLMSFMDNYQLKKLIETKDDNGNKITLQFNNPEYSATLTKAYKENQKKSKSTSNSSSESSAKVGNILGWTNVRLPSNNKPNTAVFDQGTGAKIYSKDDLVGATEVNPLDLTRAEEIIRDTSIQDNPEIDVNKLKFYRQWVNPAGIPCLKTTEGAKQVFLITDKK